MLKTLLLPDLLVAYWPTTNGKYFFIFINCFAAWPYLRTFSSHSAFLLSLRGFSLLYSDGILIDGMTVKGYTDTLKYITTPTNRQKICSRADWSHEGIRMMTKKNRYGETDPNRGLRLKNVVFSDFGK
jgi:hypothetical protein